MIATIGTAVTGKEGFFCSVIQTTIGIENTFIWIITVKFLITEHT
jgi:hypothetical protein